MKTVAKSQIDPYRTQSDTIMQSMIKRIGIEVGRKHKFGMMTFSDRGIEFNTMQGSGGYFIDASEIESIVDDYIGEYQIVLKNGLRIWFSLGVGSLLGGISSTDAGAVGGSNGIKRGVNDLVFILTAGPVWNYFFKRKLETTINLEKTNSKARISFIQTLVMVYLAVGASVAAALILL